ncbi:MAG: outer membrane beta-barrel protein [Halofilum sp. (in: g-proteobacteria)]
MRHLLLSTAAASAVAIAAPAHAIDYDYFEARYTVSGDAVDVGDVTGPGFEASRSFDNEWLFARASGDFYAVDQGSEDGTLDLFSIGPGARLPLTAGRNAVDLYGALNYQRVATGNVESGIGVDVGVAMDITDRIEGRLQATRMDNDDVDLDLYEARVAYDVDSDWSVTGSLLTGDAEVSGSDRDPDNLVRLGARFRF